MNCAEAAEKFAKRQSCEKVDPKILDKARDHIFMCGCKDCSNLKNALNGEGIPISIGQG